MKKYTQKREDLSYYVYSDIKEYDKTEFNTIHVYCKMSF